MNKVSFVKRGPGKAIESAIKESLDLIDYKIDEKISNIIIKPNMCYYWDYTTGQTTDPRFVEAIINYLRAEYDQQFNISIVESDASAMKTKYAFKMLGYEKMAERNNVTLVNLSDLETIKKTVLVNGNSYEFDVPTIFHDNNLLINVPKIKFMGFNIHMTCALKNMFGCNPHYRKYIYHDNISEIIIALNKLIKTDLCIVDGLYVSGYAPKKIDLIMASGDSVAVDAAAARILKVSPEKVPYIGFAEKENLGTSKYTPVGYDQNYFRDTYPGKTLSSQFLRFGLQMIKLFRLEKRMGLA